MAEEKEKKRLNKCEKWHGGMRKTKEKKRNASISARAAMEAREGQHGAASVGQRLPRLD
jgi:hypothetical protein